MKLTPVTDPNLLAELNGDAAPTGAPQSTSGGLSDDVLDRLMQAESSGDPNAVGPPVETAAGIERARGAYQILPSTARDPGYGLDPLPLEKLNDPEASRAFARQYITAVAERDFGGDIEKGIAAYNAGPGRVRAALDQDGDWRQGLPKETRDYLSKIKPSQVAAERALTPVTDPEILARLEGRPQGESPESDSTFLERAGGAFARGAARSVTSIGKALGVAQGAITDSDPRDTTAFSVSDAAQRYVEDTVGPESDAFWSVKVPEGLGSFAGFVAGGLVGRGVTLGSKAASWAVPALMGSAVESSAQFEEALDSGADIDTAMEASGYGALLGTSEALPVGQALNRLDRGSGGRIRTLLTDAIKGGTEEAAQETFQTIMSNLIASDVVAYDPERGTFEMATEGGTVGFTVGAIANTVLGLVGGRRFRQALDESGVQPDSSVAAERAQQTTEAEAPEPAQPEPEPEGYVEGGLAQPPEAAGPQPLPDDVQQALNAGDDALASARIRAREQQAPDMTLPGGGGVSAVSQTPVTAGDAAAVQIDVPDATEPLAEAQIDVARAEAETNPQPTEGQKAAGNYKKGRVTVQGIPIAIETPTGGERSGTDADGNAWSVRMPAAYGYVERTEGKDGDQVDVFVGPEPDSDRVFVIDQMDAKTGQFDEHKAVLGTRSQEDAEALYRASYSDDAGARIGGVTEMGAPEFAEWARNGDTKSPLAGEVSPSVPRARESVSEPNRNRNRNRTEPRQTAPQSLAEFIAARGGIVDEGGDLKAMNAERWHRERPGRGRLVRDAERGRGTDADPQLYSLDRAREAAEEAGYLTAGSDTTDLLAALDEDLRGTRQVPEGEIGRVDVEAETRRVQAANRDAMEREADDLGVDYDHTVRDADLGARIVEARGKQALKDRDANTAARLAEQTEDEADRIVREVLDTESPEIADGIRDDSDIIPFFGDPEPRPAESAQEDAGQARPVGRGQGQAGRSDPTPEAGDPAGPAGRKGRRDQDAAAGDERARAGQGRGLGVEPSALRDGDQVTVTLRSGGPRGGRVLSGGVQRQGRRITITQSDASSLVGKASEPIWPDDIERAERLSTPAATEQTDQGEQALAPGVAPVSDRDKAEAKGNRKLTGRGPQKALDDGLFDTGARKQTDLLDQPAEPGGEPMYARARRPGPEPKREQDIERARTEAAIRASVHKTLRTIAPGANVRMVNRILPASAGAFERSGGQDGDTIAGEYIDGVIRLALNAFDDPKQAAQYAGHEAIHFLREAGLFTAAEWRVLEDRSRSQWMREFGLPDRPNDARVVEEGIAYAYQNWSPGKYGGAVSRLMRKIQTFVARLRNALKGLGFQSADDVFRAISQGEVGRRQANPLSYRTGFLLNAVEPSYARASLMDTAVAVPNRTMWDEIREAHRPLRDSLKAAASKQVLTTTLDRVRTRMQDKMLPLLRAQQAIERMVGRPLRETENAYLAEELYSGRAGDKLFRFNKQHKEPLVHAIHDFGQKHGDEALAAHLRSVGQDPEGLAGHELAAAVAESYLYARHAPERNAQIAKINPEIPEGGSGMTDQQAAQAMQDLRDRGLMPDLEAMAGRVDAVVALNLDERVENGLMDAQTRKQWRDLYPNWVPLRGFEDLDAPVAGDEAGRPRQGRGYDVSGPESRRAFGRQSRATDLLGNVLMVAEEGIVRGEKNRVGQAIYTLVSNNPDPAYWEVDKTERKPFINDDGEVEYRTAPYDNRDDTLHVKIDGKSRRITFHDRRLAKAVLNMDPDQVGPFMRALMRINRFLSQANTGYNPEFLVTNAFRDITAASVNMQQYNLDGLVRDTLRDYRKALQGSWRGVWGNDDTEWAQYFREFSASGGKVAFFKIDDLDEQRSQLARELKLLDGSSSSQVKTALRKVGEFVEHANSAVENAVRLSAYVNARRRGVSKAQAASISKNLTVNFNRRGELGPQMNALYLFYNASIQGSVVIFNAMRSKKVRRLVGGIVATGFAVEMLNAMLSPEDDDGELVYDKINAFHKSRNLIVMDPFGEGYFKLPLPYGYNAFFDLGRNIAAAARGAQSPLESAGNALSSVADAFNPIGGSETLLNFIAPTVIDPMVDISQNEDFAGRPIMPERLPFGPQPPESERYFANVGPISQAGASMLNRATGGNEFRPGAISVSPEVLDHTFQQVTGAAGAFAERVASFPVRLQRYLLGETDAITWNDVPFARKVVGETGVWLDRSSAYDRFAEVEQLRYEVRGLAEAGDMGAARAARDRYENRLALYEMAQGLRDRLSRIRRYKERTETAYSGAEQVSRLDRLEQMEKRLLDRWNQSYLRALKADEAQ